MRARTDIGTVQNGLLGALSILKNGLDLTDPEIESAWAEIETFCAISVRIMAKTNPSKIRDIAMTLEIQARINNRKVIEG